MQKKTLKDLSLQGQTVLVRADFNVPMKDGQVTNDKRILATLPTIQAIVEQGGKLVLFSHLGRVKTEADKEGKSLRPVAERLSTLIGKDVVFVPHTRGPELESAINRLEAGDVLLVENTRFEDVDGQKESTNDPELGAYWASLGDVFVNDAFGTAHRSHASNVGIASHLDSAVGLLIEKEMRYIGAAVDQPERPFVAILGGAKISDKIGVIDSLMDKADKVLIGGGMAYTFFKAQGKEIGTSIVEEDKVPLAKRLLAQGDTLVLPKDSVVVPEFNNDAPSQICSGDFPEQMMGLDIGPETVAYYSEILKEAKTVIWNGPMGVFELPSFAKGTIGICEALAGLTDATTIIGGGDSAKAAEQLGYADDFTHISTGGGATLAYLEGQPLPGLAVISDK